MLGIEIECFLSGFDYSCDCFNLFFFIQNNRSSAFIKPCRDFLGCNFDLFYGKKHLKIRCFFFIFEVIII